MVDNPHIAPFVRMNIVVAQFLYVGIGQSREAAEHEDIFDDSRFIIGDTDVHYSTQFRFRKEAAVTAGYVNVEPGERIGSDPTVPESRIAHQLQFLDRGMDTAGEHTPYRREVNHILLDKLTFQFPERYIFQLIFVLQECGQIAAGTGVILERPRRAVFAYALLGELGQVSVERLQKELVAVSESQPCVLNLLGSDITVTVADALVLLADVGLDILQLLVDALGDDALAGGFVGFGVPQLG